MSERPNVLLILVDQVRRDTIGCYGGPICRTPFIDQLAQDGLRFDSAYTSISLCSPARSSIFSGLLSHAHGMLYNTSPAGYGRDTLVEGVRLIDRYLGQAGYRCGYAGKWHIDRIGPAGHGFDGAQFAGFGLPTQFVQEYDRFLQAQGLPGMRGVEVRDYHTPQGCADTRMPVPFGYDGVVRAPTELTPAGFVASKTIELLEQMKGGPFFMTASFWGPHHPALPSEEFADLYPEEDIPEWPNFSDDLSDKPRIQKRYSRCLHRSFTDRPWSAWTSTVSRHMAFTTMIDSQIGRIMKSLRSLGLDRNTVVIFTSDHGDTLGCHGGQFDKGPYAYQETYAVPLLMRFPEAEGETVPGGSVSASLVSNMDLFATILDLAGLEIPEGIHARSFAGVRNDVKAEIRDSLVAEFNGFDRRGMYLQRMIWSGRHKYVFNPGDFDELYDLEQDPHELRNLISEPDAARVRRELASKLSEQMKRTDDPFAQHVDDFLEL